MSIRKVVHFICLALILFSVPFSAAADENRWWPVQAMPKALVRTKSQSEPPSLRASGEMMAQSVAGLAAKGVNEGRADEMVWVSIDDNVDVEDWLARLLQRHPQLEMRRPAPVHRDPLSWEEETPKGWGGARIFWERLCGL
jgi:hypothetical protein